MADFTLVKSSTKLLDNISVAAGGTQSAVIDCRTAHGGILSIQIKNGATGPTTPCVAYVGISHNTGTMPTASTTWGTDWFLLTALYGTISNNDVRNCPPIEIPAGVQHVEVVNTGNTGQAVTVTAVMSLVTKVVSA